MHIRITLRILLLFTLVFANISEALCQVPVIKSINKVVIEGRVYYIHRVKPGQTLYSVSKAYEITESEIIRENPGVDKIMPVGQALKIPVVPSGPQVSTIEVPVEKSGYFLHEVKEKETVYSISKKYNLSVRNIENANPELDPSKLSAGQKIYIPDIMQEVIQTEYILHKVKRRENIYRICKRYQISEVELKLHNPELRTSFPFPGQILKIPVIRSGSEKVVQIPAEQPAETDSVFADSVYNYALDTLPDFKGTLNIAYLIPFDFSAEDLQDTIAEPAIGKTKNVQREFENMFPASQNFLEFLEGSLIAIDKLSSEGLSVNVSVFDTRRSPDRLREILNSEGFGKTDLIIGPFHSFNVRIAAEYAKQNHIPIVSPFYGGDELTISNPYLFQISPSFHTQFDQYARYIKSIPDANIIIIRGNNAGIENNAHIEYLKENINQDYDSAVRDLIYKNENKNVFIQEVTNALSKTGENLVVIPETDEIAIPLSTIVTHLFFLQKNYNYKIQLLGMPEWTQFQGIDYAYLHELSFRYLTPYYFSYDSPDVKDFLRSYTKSYYSEPASYTRMGCSYALMGYDLSYFFLNSMKNRGRQFIGQIGENQEGQLMNDFHFENISISGGFENRSLMLVKFLPDITVAAEKFYPPPQP